MGINAEYMGHVRRFLRSLDRTSHIMKLIVFSLLLAYAMAVPAPDAEAKPELRPTLPFCIHILLAYTVITTLTITMAIMATPTIISLGKEVLNNNPALGEKLRLHPCPRLDPRLMPNLMLRLTHGIITIITMDIPIAIIMGTMATLTTDVTGMANRFKNSSV